MMISEIDLQLLEIMCKNLGPIRCMYEEDDTKLFNMREHLRRIIDRLREEQFSREP